MSRTDFLKRAEFLAAILLSALSIFLLAVRATHAGGLWRDECAVVQLAQMPSVSDIVHNFQHEAFPPPFPIVVRGYTTLFGPTDTALRIFGFAIGCLLLAAFWINSRLLRGGVPLVALALISLNTTFFTWGTTVRGYGLGSALIVLVFGAIGSLLLTTNPKRALFVTFICLFGVQILLYNSVLLLAISGAAALIFLVHRRFKQALTVIATCAAALLFLLPWVPAYLHARDWNIVVRGTPSIRSLWAFLEVALGNPVYGVPAIWYGTVIGLSGLIVFRTYRTRDAQSRARWELIWFAAIVCGFSIAGYYLFLRALSYPPNTWYYLPLACVVAAALDLIASELCAVDWLRLIRLGLASAALIIGPFADWSAITERQTNVDLAAQSVTERASKNDLIVVVPWQFGISFNRYYQGSTTWMTIPNIEDHRVHRYDLVKAKMISENPIDDLTEGIRAALSSGNRVWFVGGLNLPRPEEGPMKLPPAPDSRFKWDNRAYTAAWWQELSVLVVTHANKIDSVRLPQTEPIRVHELEQTSVAVAEGWH